MHAHRDYSNETLFSSCFRKLHSIASGPPKILQEIKDFDDDLALQLEALKPKDGDGAKVLCLSWLTRMLTLALDRHIQAVSLIPPLDFPLLVCDEKWMSEYMDQTARMLDVCNALSRTLSNIEQSQLLIRHACHILLDAENAPLKQGKHSDSHTHEVQLARARKSLQEWLNLQVLSGPSAPKYSLILQDMMKNLRPPRERDLRKGRGFLYALYGANSAAVFALYVLALALLDEGELFTLSVSASASPAVSWSTSIAQLMQAAKDEAKEKKDSNGCFEDLSALNSSVRGLLGLIERLLESSKESLMEEEGIVEVEERELPEGSASIVAGAAKDLCAQMDEIAKGLELLGTTLNEMFKVIVTSRSALLDKLGDFGSENL